MDFTEAAAAGELSPSPTAANTLDSANSIHALRIQWLPAVAVFGPFDGL